MTALLTPTSRGFITPDGGPFTHIKPPTEHRGPSSDLAALSPWIVGADLTDIGLPLGRIITKTGKVGVFHCDPISWFRRARMISSPSLFALGLNGLGKSSLLRRFIVGGRGYGWPSLVLGDLKGEHIWAIEAIGGQCINLGPGLDRLNVLDMTTAQEAARTIGGTEGEKVLSIARARRQATVESLFAIDWGTSPASRIRNLLGEALSVMDDSTGGEPELADLLRVILHGPDSVLSVAAVEDMAEYRRLIVDLQSTLTTWVKGLGLGELFAGKGTVKMVPGQSAVFNVSSINQDDFRMRASAMVASWAMGFGHISIAHALGDFTPYQVFQDEIWQVLQLPGMVDRYDPLTRLDRSMLVARFMASHGIGDLDALQNTGDRIKAMGFVSRSGIVMSAGLDDTEVERLSKVIHITDGGRDFLTSNAAMSRNVGATGQHPGCGNFLAMKTRDHSPGTPFHLDLCPVEMGEMNDTNQNWNMR